MTFFGALFPDAAGAVVLHSATFAEIDLGVSTGGDALDYADLRARAEGAAGNNVVVSFVGDATSPAGSIAENAIPVPTVTVHFQPNVTTVAQLYALLETSAYVQLVGAWDPVAVLVDTDAFTNHVTTGGTSAYASGVPYWGPLFPDAQLVAVDPTIVAPAGPDGAATFALLVEAGLEVTYSWSTNIFKADDGSERRASRIALPRQSYAGDAFLIGADVNETRNLLRAFAARGSTFLLGLAHEATTTLSDADERTLPVSATAQLDWAVPGQRVVVVTPDNETRVVTLQSKTSTTLVFDKEFVAPIDGGVGDAPAGSVVMPLVAVLLDPRQGFARFATEENLERWRLAARAVGFGFRSGNIPAQLALEPHTTSGALDDVVLVSLTPGAGANGILVTLVGDVVGDPSTEVVVMGGVVEEIVIHFQPGVTTTDDLHDVVVGELYDYLAMTGEWNPALTLAAGDAFSVTLAGGAQEAPAPVGVGATLITHQGRPVFDRGVSADGSGDSVHGLFQILDLGESPVTYGSASVPDWGRQVALSRSSLAEWQWLKKFLWTVRGAWKSWWLPTYRQDLEPVGALTGGGTALVVSADVGNFFDWYPLHRKHVMVRQNGVDRFAEITAASGLTSTITLTLSTGSGLVDGSVELVSWLELCRLESDDVTVTWEGWTFSVSTTARVVQR